MTTTKKIFLWYQSQRDLHLFCKFGMMFTWTKNIGNDSYHNSRLSIHTHYKHALQNSKHYMYTSHTGKKTLSHPLNVIQPCTDTSTHTHTHKHALTHTHTHALSLTHTHTQTHIHAHTHTPSPSHTQPLLHTLSLTHTPSPSHTHTCTHTHTHTHPLPHTHTNTHTHRQRNTTHSCAILPLHQSHRPTYPPHTHTHLFPGSAYYTCHTDTAWCHCATSCVASAAQCGKIPDGKGHNGTVWCGICGDCWGGAQRRRPDCSIHTCDSALQGRPADIGLKTKTALETGTFWYSLLLWFIWGRRMV